MAAAYVLILAALGPLAPRLADPISTSHRKKLRARRLQSTTDVEPAV
jgi:CPA2 family monovalent cation:H+ antiporter-2